MNVLVVGAAKLQKQSIRMHQYLENVRNEIELETGQESYLASSLFLRIYRHIGYEDDGAYKLADKESFEKIQHKAINCLAGNCEFNLKDEILAWQAAILRDIAKEFYGWWVDHKDEKFRAQDCFEDGEACMALESSAEQLGENPTELYTKLLKVELLLTRLCTSCNKTLLEVDRYWQFKYKNRKKAPENGFMERRIAAESRSTILFESIEAIREVSQTCLHNAKRLSGAYYLLWINPHIMLESLICSLNGFLHFEYIPGEDLSLMDWLQTLFPKRLPDASINPMCESPLHHKIIASLSQATQCLVEHTVNRTDAFAQRDAILKRHIVDKLEKIKMIQLQNLQSEKESDLQESCNSS